MILSLRIAAMRCYQLCYCWLTFVGSHGDHPGHGIF